MAEYGVQLINDKNYVIANASDVNYILRSSGQINNSQFPTNTGGYYSRVYMDLSAFNNPIIFFRPMTAEQRVACIPGINDFQTAGSVTQKRATVLKWPNKDIGTLQYYIFDRWIPPERSEYGMQIFDATGGIIFDTGWNFMIVRAVKWLDPGYPNHDTTDPDGGNWTNLGALGSGNLAVSLPNPRGWIYTGWSTFGVMLYECVHLTGSDNQAVVSLVPRGEYLDMVPAGGWAHENTRSQMMIVDVSQSPVSYNPVRIEN
ncbi:hypothetical protein [Erwinia phyllosphaerae]|uniref:hypothetical protein n=1 Tax=Erwinia phyllosphaerae TaxID=2853256 RepID=UPI001FEF7925|nr:hypothetical protein [Erwinia phyllosphaerae]MBV4366305.1 hypothetical protein [Erwinia phyllosphaerae]